MIVAKRSTFRDGDPEKGEDSFGWSGNGRSRMSDKGSDFFLTRMEKVSVRIVSSIGARSTVQGRFHDAQGFGTDDPRLSFFEAIQ